MPYHPGFIFAAFETDDGSQDETVNVFNTMPAFLADHIHVLDVSWKQVMHFLKNLFCNVINSFRSQLVEPSMPIVKVVGVFQWIISRCVLLDRLIISISNCLFSDLLSSRSEGQLQPRGTG